LSVNVIDSYLSLSNELVLLLINEITLHLAQLVLLQAGKPSQYVTSNPGQLSLAIPPWVGAVSTSESGRVK